MVERQISHDVLCVKLVLRVSTKVNNTKTAEKKNKSLLFFISLLANIFGFWNNTQVDHLPSLFSKVSLFLLYLLSIML